MPHPPGSTINDFHWLVRISFDQSMRTHHSNHYMVIPLVNHSTNLAKNPLFCGLIFLINPVLGGTRFIPWTKLPPIAYTFPSLLFLRLRQNLDLCRNLGLLLTAAPLLSVLKLDCDKILFHFNLDRFGIFLD